VKIKHLLTFISACNRLQTDNVFDNQVIMQISKF